MDAPGSPDRDSPVEVGGSPLELDALNRVGMFLHARQMQLDAVKSRLALTSVSAPGPRHTIDAILGLSGARPPPAASPQHNESAGQSRTLAQNTNSSSVADTGRVRLLGRPERRKRGLVPLNSCAVRVQTDRVACRGLPPYEQSCRRKTSAKLKRYVHVSKARTIDGRQRAAGGGRGRGRGRRRPDPAGNRLTPTPSRVSAVLF
ncbi:hypothetical protein EVAR_31804_1 [Eumeta japonica]|uniref:Uncharacterized protein n=1 Tax=Eumeta variegata TaxID=151549 RepID=A0A4C1W727_EUMVA|nr:hypothetical protein EVAR_31804_1 [Eumeta japonica]